MIVSITHFDWQVLRFVLRAESAGEFPTGRELRLVPMRRTKDGTFLDVLVETGFLEVAAKAPPLNGRPIPGETPEPEQFRKRYRITDLGLHAAEYGEYDLAFVPTPQPLKGTAAEMSLGQRAPGARGRDGKTHRKPHGTQRSTKKRSK